jgi:hypothetical protein
MVWSDGFPSPSDSPDNRLASLLTTQKVAFRTAIEKHSFWTDSSLASAGIPRLSMNSFGPGSCRAYFAPASSLSTHAAADKAITGRLFVTSDTSRLYTWMIPNASYGLLDDQYTVLVGGKNAIVWKPSTATITPNFRVMVQNGTSVCTVGSRNTIDLPLGYAATAPAIQLQAMSTVTTDLVNIALIASTRTNFTVSALTVFGSTATSFSVMWRSHGTAAL